MYVVPKQFFVRNCLKINAFRISAKNFSKKIGEMFGRSEKTLYLCKRKREITNSSVTYVANGFSTDRQNKTNKH